jgi:hypothetical protein
LKPLLWLAAAVQDQTELGCLPELVVAVLVVYCITISLRLYRTQLTQLRSAQAAQAVLLQLQ